MINRTLIILLFALPIMAWSQDYVTISGQILDVETKKPIPFSTINIQNTPVGIVANTNGEFAFTFTKEYLTDSIVFSSTGYQTEKIFAQKLVSENKVTIELVSKAIVLSEVVVTNKELTAWEILEIALSKIKTNYPTKPFEFDAFYRDYKLEDEQCISIFEAAVSVYDKGYSKGGNRDAFKEKVVLKQVRKSLKTKYRTHAFRRINVMKELITLNDVRYRTRLLDKKNKRKYTYELDGYEVINDRLMHKIKVKEDWSYFVYVDVVTYAIPRIEMDFKWIEGEDENKWSLGDTIRYNQTAATMLMDFQLIDGLYYPKYCSFTANLEASDFDTNEKLFTSYLRQEYMVTDIDFKPKEKPEKDLRMDPDLIIEDQKFTYNPKFWENYNIIKLHPRDEKLIEGLEELYLK